MVGENKYANFKTWHVVSSAHVTEKVLNDEGQQSRQFNNAVIIWIDFGETASKHCLFSDSVTISKLRRLFADIVSCGPCVITFLPRGPQNPPVFVILITLGDVSSRRQ